jgi:heme exporter protein B
VSEVRALPLEPARATAVGRVALVIERELLAERRQPDGVVAAITFIAVLVLLESLVVGPSAARTADVASGLFWIALAFAAILATMRSFDRELEDDALEGLVALPGGRDALFGGKVIALAIALALVALVGGLLSVVLLDLSVALPLHLVVVVAAGVMALPPIVVVDVVLALRLRARAALVPILALPVLVPQLVAATRGASAALTGDAAAALSWSGLLFAFAVVYAVVGLTIVPAAIE